MGERGGAGGTERSRQDADGEDGGGNWRAAWGPPGRTLAGGRGESCGDGVRFEGGKTSMGEKASARAGVCMDENTGRRPETEG